MTIGKQLLELRTKKKLSQAELAQELGISRVTYANWEIDRRRPELNSLIQLADYYDVSVDYLLERENVVVAASQAGDFLADLNDEARRSVEDFIEFVHQRQKNK